MNQTVSSEAITRAADTWRAGLVVDLSTLTLLIHSGLITGEQAASRIETIHAALGESFQSDGVCERLQAVTDYLRLFRSP